MCFSIQSFLFEWVFLYWAIEHVATLPFAGLSGHSHAFIYGKAHTDSPRTYKAQGGALNPAPLVARPCSMYIFESKPLDGLCVACSSFTVNGSMESRC